MPRASKKKAPKKKITKSKLKADAKRLGRKVEQEAKTDVGRASIGGVAGALLLGPIGVFPGVYAGLKSKKKSRKSKNRTPKKR